MKPRHSLLLFALAVLIGCGGAPAPESAPQPEPDVPIVILDALPEDGRMKTHNARGAGDISAAHRIRLPNGLALVVSDMRQMPENNAFEIAEDDIYVVRPNGDKTLVANGWGFGDYRRDIFPGDKIVIRETFCRGRNCRIKLPVREWELKCSASDCGFFKNADCLLAPFPARPVSEIWAGLKKAHSEQNTNLLMDELDELFLAAIAGDDALFLDREKLYAELRLDAGPSEAYGILRDHYDEYKKDCR